jgi:hypothetical protein
MQATTSPAVPIPSYQVLKTEKEADLSLSSLLTAHYDCTVRGNLYPETPDHILDHYIFG